MGRNEIQYLSGRDRTELREDSLVTAFACLMFIPIQSLTYNSNIKTQRALHLLYLRLPTVKGSF